jgi:hypothetical protein
MTRLFVALLLVLGMVSAAQAQSSFAPKNYAECVMLNVKKAASKDGAMLMRRACKCRFQEPAPEECKQYSKGAVDCMLSNLGPVEVDAAAWGVERACRNKFPVQ